jgi:Asp-tRNA(Asn)/Glu-tRNA(Gln) amidotransferase A subunit family amidase
MHEVIYASTTALARAIRAKEISSAEVVQAYLKRIASVNPALNAVVKLRGRRREPPMPPWRGGRSPAPCTGCP